MLHLLTRHCAFAAHRLTMLHADALLTLTSIEEPSSRPKAERSADAAEKPALSLSKGPPYSVVPPPLRRQLLRHGAEPPLPFDLVTTHFFLDCFSTPDLARLIPAIRANLAPNALWVISDFRIPTSGPLRLPARIFVRILYLAFRLLTGLEPTHLPNHTTLLRQAGFTPLSIHHFLAGLLTAELWQLPPASHSALADPR